jgi:hypothetical protein
MLNDAALNSEFEKDRPSTERAGDMSNGEPDLHPRLTHSIPEDFAPVAPTKRVRKTRSSTAAAGETGTSDVGRRRNLTRKQATSTWASVAIAIGFAIFYAILPAEAQAVLYFLFQIVSVVGSCAEMFNS